MKRKIQRVNLLTKKEERTQVRKSFMLAFISIIIAFLIFSYGIGVLSGFAEILNKIFTNDKDSQTERSDLLQPPILDELPQATNSAKIKISGLSFQGKKALVFLNGEKVSETEVSADRFLFDDFSLKDGVNEIKAKSVGENNLESDFSVAFTIVLDKKEPEFIVDSPTEDQSFSGNNRISVKGKVEEDAQVLANGFLANVNTEGNFEVFVPLNEGDNEIEIKAIDIAGNIKSQKIKVHFSK